MSINLNIRDELPTDAVVFDNYAYDNSIIGVTLDGRAIYAYELMVQELMNDKNLDALSRLNYMGEYIFAFDEPKYQPLLDKKLVLMKKYISKPWKLKFYILSPFNGFETTL